MIKIMSMYLSEDNNSDDDLGIYSRKIRETMLEDDELSPFEDAFMNGYESEDD